MADDYDFDDDFADDNIQQSYDKPTKKTETKVLKKQPSGAKKANDDFESFDMEDIKDDFEDSHSKSKKPAAPIKDVKPQIKENIPENKPLTIPAKEDKIAVKKKNDDSDDFEIDDDDTFNKKVENKPLNKPQLKQQADFALPKTNAQPQKETGSASKNKNGFDDLDFDDDDTYNKKLENKPQIKPVLKPQPEVVQAKPNLQNQAVTKKKEASDDGSNYDEDFDRDEEYPPKKNNDRPVLSQNKANKEEDLNNKVKKEVNTFLDDMNTKITAPTQKYEAPESKAIVKSAARERQEPPAIREKPQEPKAVEKPVSLQMKAEMMTPQYQKLLEQNKKLKEELRGLAKAADEALQRERQHRSSKKNREEEPELKERMQELREQLGKIDQLKHHITIMKRQLKNTYNLPKVVEKEDELKAAQKELSKVVEEKNSLLKIKKEQNKALDFLNNEGEYEKKLKQVTQELRQVKEDYRKENELFQENDKAMKKLHEKIIVTEERCRELQKKIKDKKGEKPKSQGPTDVSREDVASLESKVKELQEKKNMVEKGFEEETRALEKKKKALQNENGKLAMMLKDKEKEIRLNNLRLKELRKLSRYNAIKPITENPPGGREVSATRGSSRGSEIETRSKSNNAIKKLPSKGSDKKMLPKNSNEKLILKNRIDEKSGQKAANDSFDDDQDEAFETPQKSSKLDKEEKSHRGRNADTGSQRSNRDKLKSGPKVEAVEDEYEDDRNFEEAEQVEDQFEDKHNDKESSREIPTNPFAKPNLMKKKV